MKRWRNHNFLAVILAAFVTLSLSVSAVNASVMGIKMAIAADVTDLGGKGCANCPDDSDGAVACDNFCVVIAFATLSAQLDMAFVTPPWRYAPLHALPRDGPRSNEPYPPKSFTIS